MSDIIAIVLTSQETGTSGQFFWQSGAQSASFPFHLYGIGGHNQLPSVPLGPINTIGQQPACPSLFPPDSLWVHPYRRPAGQYEAGESKGATYQVDYQGVPLWLITTECAHNECC